MTIPGLSVTISATSELPESAYTFASNANFQLGCGAVVRMDRLRGESMFKRGNGLAIWARPYDDGCRSVYRRAAEGAATADSAITEGTTVYRVFGGEAQGVCRELTQDRR